MTSSHLLTGHNEEQPIIPQLQNWILFNLK